MKRKAKAMKTFDLVAAQGEITIYRIGDLDALAGKVGLWPVGFRPLDLEGGKLIIGHSETGHHHVMDPETTSAAVMERPPQGMKILQMIVKSPTPLIHLRDHDTHDPVMLEPGIYEARIAREYNPYTKLAQLMAD